MARKFDPRNHIDRNSEQELFRGLVSYDSPARILTICDYGGRGKSSLLTRLRYNCGYEIKPEIPCCLLELDKLSERDPTAFGFAHALANGFSTRSETVAVRFAKFHALDGARTAKDFTPFQNGASAYRARDPYVAGRAETMVMHGGQTIGQQTQIAQAQNVQVVGIMDLTEEQEELAKQQCVVALFDDLRSICATDPMVLLLDAWERCNLDLRDWLFEEFLGRHVLHPDPHLRPDKLVVVIASRPHEPGETPHGLRDDELQPLFDSDADFAATVRSRRSLSEWDTPHIREFMVQNGCREPTDVQVGLIREQLAGGRSLEKILQLIDEHLRYEATRR